MSDAETGSCFIDTNIWLYASKPKLWSIFCAHYLLSAIPSLHDDPALEWDRNSQRCRIRAACYGKQTNNSLPDAVLAVAYTNMLG